MRGRYIVFEGMDCSGKSIQSRKIYQRLLEMRYDVDLISEPTTSGIGNFIREEYLSGKTGISDKALTLLFAADRYELAYGENGTKSKLLNGTHVISDRSYISNLVYQDDKRFALDVNKHIVAGMRPDILFMFFTTADISMKVLDSRGESDIYENVNKIEASYLQYKKSVKLLKEKGIKVISIDTSGSSMNNTTDVVFSNIKSLLKG